MKPLGRIPICGGIEAARAAAELLTGAKKQPAKMGLQVVPVTLVVSGSLSPQPPPAFKPAYQPVHDAIGGGNGDALSGMSAAIAVPYMPSKVIAAKANRKYSRIKIS
jgi:hypothetical protein